MSIYDNVPAAEMDDPAVNPTALDPCKCLKNSVGYCYLCTHAHQAGACCGDLARRSAPAQPALPRCDNCRETYRRGHWPTGRCGNGTTFWKTSRTPQVPEALQLSASCPDCHAPVGVQCVTTVWHAQDGQYVPTHVTRATPHGHRLKRVLKFGPANRN
jgi:hypothetical protein